MSWIGFSLIYHDTRAFVLHYFVENAKEIDAREDVAPSKDRIVSIFLIQIQKRVQSCQFNVQVKMSRNLLHHRLAQFVRRSRSWESLDARNCDKQNNQFEYSF